MKLGHNFRAYKFTSIFCLFQGLRRYNHEPVFFIGYDIELSMPILFCFFSTISLIYMLEKWH